MSIRDAVNRNDIAWSAKRCAVAFRHAWHLSSYGEATDAYRSYLRRTMRYYALEAVQHARKELARKEAV